MGGRTGIAATLFSNQGRTIVPIFFIWTKYGSQTSSKFFRWLFKGMEPHDPMSILNLVVSKNSGHLIWTQNNSILHKSRRQTRTPTVWKLPYVPTIHDVDCCSSKASEVQEGPRVGPANVTTPLSWLPGATGPRKFSDSLRLLSYGVYRASQI